MCVIWIIVCFLLFVFQGVESDVKVIKENDAAIISCNADFPSLFFWFRLKENDQSFEYIAMYSRSKNVGKASDPEKFEVSEKTLKVKQFVRQKDSGTYSCVSINNNALKFSCTTKLRGETVPTTIKPKVQTTPMQAVASTTTAAVPCTQNNKGKASGNIDVLLGCEQRIFIPLAAGCGFLLLLLLVTILYCNRIRTRRCPHHYNRQPRGRPAGHKTLPNPPGY